MLTQARQVISVIDADPELAAVLDGDELALARRHAVAAAFALPKGPVGELPEPDGDDAQRYGLLILDGLMMRELDIAGRQTAELLGRGDLIRPWDEDPLDPLPGEVRWSVTVPARVAALDRRFAAVAGRFPALQEVLASRIDARARLLGLQRALAQIPRVDARVLVLLWRLADRWGHVTTEGVQLPIPLTHDTVAKLVGARRPSVTTAVGVLIERGLVERGRGGYTLHGDPAAALPAML
ncbi:MAG: helix-turn-helix domain-containing protein [Baekduia sp.]